MHDVDETWTLPELVSRAATRIAAMPASTNGQVRAVPDERTVRYYGTLGLLDRPLAMRGRTALYGPRHLAQVIAIKRFQATGRSLAEIQALWPSLDDATLARMSGVAIAPKAKGARDEFWKRAPAVVAAIADASAPAPHVTPKLARAPRVERDAAVASEAPVELRLELAPHVTLTIDVAAILAASPELGDVALSLADVRAIRAAAAPLIAELARRQLATHAETRDDRDGQNDRNDRNDRNEEETP